MAWCHCHEKRNIIVDHCTLCSAHIRTHIACFQSCHHGRDVPSSGLAAALFVCSQLIVVCYSKSKQSQSTHCENTFFFSIVGDVLIASQSSKTCTFSVYNVLINNTTQRNIDADGVFSSYLPKSIFIQALTIYWIVFSVVFIIYYASVPLPTNSNANKLCDTSLYRMLYAYINSSEYSTMDCDP